MTKAGQVSSALIPTAPLLLTESKDEFNLIRDTLNEQIKPRGIIEQMYVEDIAYLVWEILRLRRGKVAILNLAFRDALTEVVTQLLHKPGDWKNRQKDHAEKLRANGSPTQMSKSRSPDCSGNSTSMKLPLKQKRSESRPMTSRGSTALWLQQKPAATRHSCA